MHMVWVTLDYKQGPITQARSILFRWETRMVVSIRWFHFMQRTQKVRPIASPLVPRTRVTKPSQNTFPFFLIYGQIPANNEYKMGNYRSITYQSLIRSLNKQVMIVQSMKNQNHNMPGFKNVPQEQSFLLPPKLVPSIPMHLDCSDKERKFLLLLCQFQN